MKKLLILSMTCGEGHNTIAKALSKEATFQGIKNKIVDIYDSNKFEKFFNNYSYLFAMKYFPKVFEFFWFKYRKRNPDKRYNGGLQIQIKDVEKTIKKEIENFNPDAIICSHFYAGAILANLKRKNELNIPFYSILSDFAIHPGWETNILADAIFMPSKYSTDDMVKKGFKEEQLIVTGFPVDKKFTTVLNKIETRKKLGLQNKFTVMLMGGGNGIGQMFNLLKKILKANSKPQVIVACGKNKFLKKQIEDYIKSKKLTQVKVYGFVNNIDELMSASNCIFSRGGCGSLTESLNKQIPIIIRENMVIQEKLNEDLLVQNGSAIMMNNISDAPKIIDDLVKNPNKLKKLIKNAEQFRKPNATQDIIDYMKNYQSKKQ